MRRLRFALSAACLLAFQISWPSLSFAQTIDTARDKFLEASLISENKSWRPANKFSVGVRLLPAPGWHVYWKNPGDSGSPPKFSWSLDGYELMPSRDYWPYPKLIPYGPLANYGYDQDTLIIFEFDAPAQAKNELRLSLDLEWLVCREECLPGKALLKIALPTADGSPEPNAADAELFRRARELIPAAGPLRAKAIQLNRDNLSVIFAPEVFNEPPDEIIFFPERKGLVEPSARQIFTRRGDGSFSLTARRGRLILSPNSTISGVLTVRSGADYVEAYDISIPASIAGPEGRLELGSLAMALLFGFLGGILLNLMPCVLPVLSLKLMSLIEVSAKAKQEAQKESLIYAAGIILSLSCLGLIVGGIQGIAESSGWGFQLQSPLFVALMGLLTFCLGLNFLGVFEMGGAVQALAGRSKIGQGRLGAFGHGILAAALATPCSAPFMGSALAYGLSQGSASALVVFLALGIGMALPIVAAAYIPAALRFLPRPGAWMKTLKEILAIPLFATTIWLGWVLNLQAGSRGVAALSAAAIIFTLAAVKIKRSLHHRFSGLGLLLALGVSVFILALGVDGGAANRARTSESWAPFNSKQIARIRLSGRPVFIDFTAAWCITCQVNKATTLRTARVREMFLRNDVALFEADWTTRDAEIADALRSYGRQSVPLYVFYPKGADSEPEILPAILSPGVIEGLFTKERGGSPRDAED